MFECTTTLYPYQAEAVEKLCHLRVGALFMEQGTGKTRTTLGLLKPRLDAGKVDVVLWLCPCSVKKNLAEDILYHCGGMPSEIIIRGIESLSSSDRLYLQLHRLVQEHKVFLVVDESALVKNKKAIRTERIIELSSHCQYKLILNGTPVSRNEADLFAQFYILDWRILGYRSFYSFAANHIEYWSVKLPNGTEVVDKNRIKNVLNTEYLAEKIAPYTFQIRKKDCLTLPEKRYRAVGFSLSVEQALLYEEVREEYLINVDEMRDDTIYKLFSALQHVASGRKVLTGPTERMETEPLFEDPRDNPRIQALMETLEGNTEKCIIFCKYQHEINDIMSLLPNAVEFTGHLNQKKRQENRRRFMDDAQYLVANKSCGAYGLNLQFCHKMIFYNNDFSLATRLQAEDRIHRIGQAHNVEIIDIIGWDTIDQFISDCLRRKENLAEAFKREVAAKKNLVFESTELAG